MAATPGQASDSAVRDGCSGTIDAVPFSTSVFQQLDGLWGWNKIWNGNVVDTDNDFDFRDEAESAADNWLRQRKATVS